MIAVIMSVYCHDALRNVEESLNSLYEQNIDCDIFVQLDGKVTSDIEIFLEDALKKAKITYLGRREENRGLAYSLNELLAIVMAKGYEYIARMDADDISVSGRFEKQFTFMQLHRDVDVVGGYIEEFGSDFAYHKVVRYPLAHAQMYDFFAKRVPLAHVTAFFRRSFFEKAGLYPISSPTNEDTLLWMKGFQHGCRFANIPDVLVKVRISRAFFSRRGGFKKAWSDLQDRIIVIRTLGYNSIYYIYALALLLVNIAPGSIKKFLYERVR